MSDNKEKIAMSLSRSIIIFLSIFLLLSCAVNSSVLTESSESLFATASKNAEQANEGFKRSDKFVRGWLELADPKTGLIPRNTKDLYWNAQDSAADNYPFMVLTSSFTDTSLFQGKMKDMLDTEIKLTSRIDSLPDTFDFKTQKFRTDKPNINSIIFGSSEYIKDGLLPLTEWLGKSPWYDRMIAILDDMWLHAPVETPFGKIVSDNIEVNGEMLQTLSRLYWMTGKDQYLQYAVRLGDYYLLGDHHPTNDIKHLRLRDHGCEIVSGLCELYATVSFAKPDKKKQYEKPIHQMLDRILEVGRKDDGMFYDAVNPITGEVVSKRVADTWGYTYNGIYTVYMIDKTQRYLDETKRVLKSISKYTNYAWEGASSDGYADSIESAISLYNRLPTASVAGWIDSETKVMWAKQKPTGVIEGWHGDGNFARTTIMYCLWKTKGISIHPWRADVRIGAVQNGDKLYISLISKKPWTGTIKFDQPRHKKIMKLPIDWPRINHFPEWFTAKEGVSYTLINTADSSARTYTSGQMIDGIPFSAEPNTKYRLTLTVK